MELVRVSFADSHRPERGGALSINDRGRVSLRASPVLARALEAAVADRKEDLSPLRFDNPTRGLALAASLAKGMPARLLDAELVVGTLQVRAFLGAWVKMTIEPGDFDPDLAWDFVLAVSEAKLEAPRA